MTEEAKRDEGKEGAYPVSPSVKSARRKKSVCDRRRRRTEGRKEE